jgi:hypothetical protein
MRRRMWLPENVPLGISLSVASSLLHAMDVAHAKKVVDASV